MLMLHAQRRHGRRWMSGHESRRILAEDPGNVRLVPVEVFPQATRCDHNGIARGVTFGSRAEGLLVAHRRLT